MKTIFIPQIPESITDITTNSSSEIFVIGKDKEIELVDGLIKSNGWSWWFREKKQFETIDDIKKMMFDYPHAIPHLFKFKHVPSNDVHDSYDFNEQREYVRVPSGASQAIRDIEKKLKEYSKTQQPRNVSTDSPEYQEYWKGYWVIYNEKTAQFEKELSEWADKQNLEQFVGAYYYECGEDNELSDWDEVHDTIPGDYARLS